MFTKRATTLGIKLRLLLARAFACLLVLNAIYTADSSVSGATEADDPPNIVYIMLDDADYFDVSYNNHLLANPDALTPRIDTLRAGGKAFTQFYTASAVCSPTRASVLTGMMPIQFGIEDSWLEEESVVRSSAGLGGLPAAVPQLGHLLQAAGYATGHHGKWHVGLSRPIYGHEALGFTDYSYFRMPEGRTATNWSGLFEFVADEGVKQVDVDYIDSYFADQVIAFIQQNAAKQQRFYVNYWPFSPHTPWSIPRNFDNSKTQFDLTTDRGKVLAMLYTVDREIGRIVDCLEQLDILDDTLVMVTSDNGGQQQVQNSDEYLRGHKGAFFEGGIRVPFIAHWPKRIPANSTTDQVMTTTDLLPTFLALVGADVAPLEKQIDGRSMATAFTSDQVIPHDPILWELSGNPKKTKDLRAQITYAMRDGDYKLIKAENRNDQTNPKAYFLYNIARDPGEKTNLVTKQPSLFADLRAKMLILRKEVSQYNAFPDIVTEKTVVPFDPRLDVTSRDMTLVMKIIVPDQVDSPKNLYNKPKSFTISLLPNQTIQWHIWGSTATNQRIEETLTSGVLPPGEYELVFGIQGFKNDRSRASLFVDGNLVDSTYADGTESRIVVVWSSIDDVTLGDEGITLKDMRYYNNYFWIDEL